MAKPTTKERLVEAAAGIFAKKGYRETTVAEICEAAEANIAAVNYHFGDKAHLYSEVWRFLSEKSEERFPVPKTHEEIGAEAWLRLHMRTRVKHIFSDGTEGLFPRLIAREMNDWTPQHHELAGTYLKPTRDRIRAAIRDFVGVEIEEMRLETLTQNFAGIHISLNMGYQHHRDNPLFKHRFTPIQEDESLIDQIETFAIGGLKEVKKGLTE